MKRFARLKINGTVFYLQQNIRGELTIEGMQILKGGSGAVISLLHVIDKGAPDHDAMVRRYCRRQHIGAIRMTAIVRSWPRLSFTVGLDEKTAEIRNQPVDLIRFLLPPCGDVRRERICSLQPC